MYKNYYSETDIAYYIQFSTKVDKIDNYISRTSGKFFTKLHDFSNFNSFCKI